MYGGRVREFARRERSIAAVDDALAGDRMVLLVAQRDASQEEPEPDDLYRVGTVAVVLRSNRIEALIAVADIENGGEATIVGAMFGEDSVQSGGEISLDSATIILRARDDLRVLFSQSLFTSGGIVNQFLPTVSKEIVGVLEI